jgi:proteasome lid subunit RPN8/RPN11
MDLQVVIPSAVLERLRAHATRAYPEECCGILVGQRTAEAADATSAVVVSRDIRCANTAQELDRRRRFEIDPRALIDTIRELRDGEEQIVGFYHSHPDADAELSSTDLTFVSLWPETVWLVLSVGQDGPRGERAWWLTPSPDSTEPSGSDSLREIRLLVDAAGAHARALAS